MPYSNVGKPRFYIDHLLWLKHHGLLHADSTGVFWHTGSPLEIVGLNPSNQHRLFNEGDNAGGYSYTNYSQAPHILGSDGEIKNYIAVLGHTCAAAQAMISPGWDNQGSGDLALANNVVNYNPYSIPSYNGFTIMINMDMGDEDEDMAMQEDIVQEVLKRVTKRIVAEKLKNRK